MKTRQTLLGGHPQILSLQEMSGQGPAALTLGLPTGMLGKSDLIPGTSMLTPLNPGPQSCYFYILTICALFSDSPNNPLSANGRGLSAPHPTSNNCLGRWKKKEKVRLEEKINPVESLSAAVSVSAGEELHSTHCPARLARGPQDLAPPPAPWVPGTGFLSGTFLQEIPPKAWPVPSCSQPPPHSSLCPPCGPVYIHSCSFHPHQPTRAWAVAIESPDLPDMGVHWITAHLKYCFCLFDFILLLSFEVIEDQF